MRSSSSALARRFSHSPFFSFAATPRAASTHSALSSTSFNSSKPADVEAENDAITTSDSFTSLKHLLRPLPLASTSRSPAPLSTDALYLFFLSWHAQGAYSDPRLREALAVQAQATWDLPKIWLLAALKRYNLISQAAQGEEWKSFAFAECRLLAAIQSGTISTIHQALQQLLAAYAASELHRHVGFGLLETVQHFHKDFIEHIASAERIDIRQLIQHGLRRPRTNLARHQLWTFLLSPQAATLMARPDQGEDLSKDQVELGRQRADQLAEWSFAPLFRSLSPQQHLHWVAVARGRPRTRAAALESYLDLERADEADPTIANLIAETVQELLKAEGQEARALEILQSWKGNKTQLYWVALIKAAAAVDLTTDESAASDASMHPLFDQASPRMATILQDLPMQELSPAIFIALLLAASTNVAWLSMLIKLAQITPVLSQRKTVQDALIEAVLNCFEAQAASEASVQLNAEAPVWTGDKLQLAHRAARISALGGRPDQAVDHTVEAVRLRSVQAADDQVQSRRDTRLSSMMVRCVSACLAQDRVDLALNLLLHPAVPQHLIDAQMVQRVGFAAAARKSWDSSASIKRVLLLVKRCPSSTIEEAFGRPQLFAALLHAALSVRTDRFDSDAIRSQTRIDQGVELLDALRDVVRPEDMERFISNVHCKDQQARAGLLRHVKVNFDS